jgi:rfaE bifunctional protein nucleotidyltransferase chain/domain/rfaE bifunctional protein kinase chain/domain
MMRVTVVGDALLDVDVDGRARRLAPDAPVPVVDDVSMRARPGGGALAAAMLARDGVEVSLVTAIGDDRASRRLRGLLHARGVEVTDLSGSGSTPTKARIRAGAQCITRVDLGGDAPAFRRDGVAAAAAEIERAAAVLVADYGRGVAEVDELRSAMRRGRRVIVWDPHPNGPEPVPGVHLVTPNEAEAGAFVRSAEHALSYPRGAADAADELRRRWRARAVVVTCGPRGAVLATGDGVPVALPVARPAGGDGCGAGDRFASAALRTLAAGAAPTEAVSRAVDVAATFVAEAGLSAFSELPAGSVTRRPTVVATSGCFDLLHAGHVSALRAARALGDRLIVCLNSDASVRRLKGEGRPVVAQADREAVLRSLACVDDVVVFPEDTPLRVLAELRPDFFVKGGDYDATSLPEAALLESWGGRAVVVPYLSGRSTTRLLQEARDGH